jgi:hypothetical protein
MALYDAFVSYSHAKDKPIAAALPARQCESAATRYDRMEAVVRVTVTKL